MAMQEQALAWRQGGEDIGFVPTMGALHAGHDALLDRARRENRRLIVSIFVNPRQFGPSEDFSRYPRPYEADRERLERLGVDAIFHPSPEQIYPSAFKTVVEPGPLGEVLEGRSRPGHFSGVLTVVLKLFNLTQPKRAYFGQKDFQQVVLVRQLVRDLALPVRIVTVPTVREPDGLALSSRNAYLSPEQRRAAPMVHQALQAGLLAFAAGSRSASEIEDAAVRMLEGTPGIELDYLRVLDDATLSTPVPVRRGNVLAVAVKLGSTRLIDNVVFGADAV